MNPEFREKEIRVVHYLVFVFLLIGGTYKFDDGKVVYFVTSTAEDCCMLLSLC